MIKKPEAPTLADFLRYDHEGINKKYKALADYKEKVFNSLANEFKTADAYELAIKLAEKYHEPFKIVEKQGRKKKWTPKLEAQLAVCVDIRFEDENPRSVTDEIEWLLSSTVWGRFSKRGNESEVMGNENFRKHYDSGRKNDDYAIQKELFEKDPDAWLKKLQENLIKG